MSTAPAVTVMKRTYRLYAALLAVIGVVFVYLSTLPDGGFVKGIFQGGAFALFALAIFFVVHSLRRPKPGDTDGMWRPSADVRDGSER